MDASELRDYYGLLGVPQTATVSEIHKAYWQQASRCHPDRGGSHDSMVRVVEAWKILSDPNKRARYDQLLKYRHDGWQSKKFDADVLDARKRAGEHASRSWAEFEEVYQKAFYTFNEDFYGEDIDRKASGPYSPLMGSKIKTVRSEGGLKRGFWGSEGGTMFTYLLKTVILFAAIVAAFFFYHNYSGIGRYVPLGSQDTSLVMLDSATGAVYSVEKRHGTSTSVWKETVPPFPREKRWPRK